MNEKCPYCHQSLSADAGPCAKWYCGTWQRADGEVFQTNRCRVAQLEAEIARLKAINCPSWMPETQTCAEAPDVAKMQNTLIGVQREIARLKAGNLQESILSAMRLVRRGQEALDTNIPENAMPAAWYIGFDTAYAAAEAAQAGKDAR